MRSLVFTLIALLAACSEPAHAAPLEFGERLAACTTCHGKQGEGAPGAEYYPHLAGKPADYLLEQLRSFRDGRRHYAQMTWLVRNMDDAYLEKIAAYFAAFPPRTGPTATSAASLDPALVARATALVREGDAAAKVPACAACHGDDLTGMEPGVPALVGLPEEYVVAQFGAWRAGIRSARAPDCMAQIANALAPADVRVLATWLATQGHAEPRRPAPAGTRTPPLACGSLQPAEAVQ